MISSTTISAKRARIECFLLVLIALLVRLDILIASNFVIDADEAIVGLMAKHISEGAPIPVFYYGQAYMGSLEAICAALLFLALGISSAALKMAPLLWSLALVVTVYFGTRRFFNVTAARIAALGVTVSSNGFLTWSIMARGGFIEIIVISIWVFFALAWWNERKGDTFRASVVGLILGLGWWTNNQIVFLALPAALLGLITIFEQRQKSIKPLLSSAVCFFIGSVPFWYYNFINDFPSSKVFGLAPFSEQKDHLVGLIKYSLPMIFGSRRFWSEEDIFPGATLLAVLLFVLPAVAALVRVLRSRRLSPLYAALIVFPWAIILFSMSKYGFLVKAPRYLLPLVPLLYIVLGYEVSHWRSTLIKWSWLAGMLLLNLSSQYLGGRAIPGQPFIYGAERAMADHAELIDILKERTITKIRTNYWIGYRLAFETQEQVTFGIIGEPRDLRLPQYAVGVTNETPLLLAPTQVARVADALRAQGRSFKIENIKRYTLIYDISKSSCADADSALKEVVLSASSNVSMLPNVLDSDLTTRWGSGAPQSPGMFLTTTLKKVVNRPLKISWSYGTFGTDFPRALEVSAKGHYEAGQSSKLILSRAGYEGLKFLNDEHPTSLYLCVPPITNSVTFTQVGKDPVFDWSIAALEVLEATR